MSGFGGAPPFVGAFVRRSTAQALALGGTPYDVGWDTAIYNVGGLWSAETPHRFIIPAGLAGYYEVKFAGEWASSALRRDLYLSHYNSSNVLAHMAAFSHLFYPAASASSEAREHTAYEGYMAAGDYINMAIAAHGGTPNFNPSFTAWAAIRRVG